MDRFVNVYFWSLYWYMHICLVIPLILASFSPVVILVLNHLLKPFGLEIQHHPSMFLPREEYITTYIILLKYYAAFNQGDKLFKRYGNKHSEKPKPGDAMAIRWLATLTVVSFIDSLFSSKWVIFHRQLKDIVIEVWFVLFASRGFQVAAHSPSVAKIGNYLIQYIDRRLELSLSQLETKTNKQENKD